MWKVMCCRLEPCERDTRSRDPHPCGHGINQSSISKENERHVENKSSVILKYGTVYKSLEGKKGHGLRIFRLHAHNCREGTGTVRWIITPSAARVFVSHP